MQEDDEEMEEVPIQSYPNLAAGGVPLTQPDLFEKLISQKDIENLLEKDERLKELKPFFNQDYILNNFNSKDMEALRHLFRYQTDLIRNSLYDSELTFEFEGLLNALEARFDAILRRSGEGFERRLQVTQIAESHALREKQKRKGWIGRFIDKFRLRK